MSENALSDIHNLLAYTASYKQHIHFKILLKR
jgi:hypothetical protein